MAAKVFVDGQEGTTGLKIFEYLRERDDIELLRIDEVARKDLDARRTLINQSDVTFLCLPDTASRESVSLVDNSNTCVIDASTAFRTDPSWAYGLPELDRQQREQIRRSKRIAVPGCHASAFLLAVRPLVAGGLLARDYPLSACSLTGYSGGGKKMIADYEGQQDGKLNSPRPYALGLDHKHLPEMKVHAGLAMPPVFVPVVANFLQGLAVTVYLQTSHLSAGASPAAVHSQLSRYYEGESFIRVAPLGDAQNLDNGFFDVEACNGTNRVDLFVFGNAERIAVVARLDNLGKGASGAAIQCMNLHLSVREDTGLKH
ncbi:MAG: N-acetyl-gamma-glutamyl-phosphate reductase [Janthinobacterium lividum]